MSTLRRYAPVTTLLLALTALYLYRLAGVGVLDPDEPRYLAIGRAMAETGDYVTPRLWGAPWFEKPPLLYWLTALGTKAHLGIELSGRLPVAVLSLVFLGTMFCLVKAEYGREAAATAVMLLGTSVGWLAYSSFALTDLPLAVFYSLPLLLALRLVRGESKHSRRRLLLIGVSLGVATLAKGLVPIALAVPFAWFLRRWWKQWWIAFAGLLATALPWYIAVYARNGQAFLDDFFWKHHFERLYSPALQHVQPWWYYVPVLIGALLPWTPLFGFVFARGRKHDQRWWFLAICVICGVVVFSAALNKLPGYLLPLMPAAFVLLAISVNWSERFSPWWLVPCAVVIGCLPLVGRSLPDLLAAGRISIPELPKLHATEVFYVLLPLVVMALARRAWLVPLLALCFVATGFFVKIAVFPELDRTVSARSLWHNIKDVRGSVCDNRVARKWAYGLALYRGEPYPSCNTPGAHYAFALEGPAKRQPGLVPRAR